jgi:hypothetical protein
MRLTKKQLQHKIEHMICYMINDITRRNNLMKSYLDHEGKIKPGDTDIETKFRTLVVEDYSVLTQTYAVILQPLFAYIEKEMPENISKHLPRLKELYQIILDNGSFKDGCKCAACRKYNDV